VANLLAFQPDERIAQVLDLRDYEQADYLVLATRRGLVKKTKLTEFDSNRSGGLIAINLRDDEDGNTDELVAARVVDEDAELMLVSTKGQALRFVANAEHLRAMGRATSGVVGMRFREGDELLAMDVVGPESHLVTVTDGGTAKRSDLHKVNNAGNLDYRVTGRGGLGVRVAKLPDERGGLVGAVIAEPSDEVLVIMQGGKVVRASVLEIPVHGRDTTGVILAKPDKGDRIIAVARNTERHLDDEPGTVGKSTASAEAEAGVEQRPEGEL